MQVRNGGMGVGCPTFMSACFRINKMCCCVLFFLFRERLNYINQKIQYEIFISSFFSKILEIIDFKTLS